MNMAWRPTRFLIEGELDNTTLGKVVGWMRFAGLPEKVAFELRGDFHRDIRGTRITFKGDNDQIDEEKACPRQKLIREQKHQILPMFSE